MYSLWVYDEGRRSGIAKDARSNLREEIKGLSREKLESIVMNIARAKIRREEASLAEESARFFDEYLV